jgi:hypothetical protein
MLPDGRDRALLEVTLLVQLAVALTGELGYAAPEVQEAYLRAQRTLGEDADPALEYPIMRGLATFHLVRGELREAHAMAERAAALAERSGRADFRIDAASVQCYTTLYYASLEACHRRIEACLALYHQHRGETLTYPVPQDAGTAALALLPTVAWLLGDARGAEQAIDRGIAHVEQLNRDFDRALMHAWVAGARFTQRRYAKALEHAGTAMTIASRHNYGEWHAVGALMALLAQAALMPAAAPAQDPAPGRQDGTADRPDPLAQAATICAAFQQRNVGLNGSYYLWGMAQGHLRCGNAAAAQAVLQAARAVAARSDETRMHAELLILSAQLASDHADARAHLSDALQTARRQGAIPVALRAAAMLVLQDNGDEDRAARAREALGCLDGTAPYPAEHDWMACMLDALAPA